MRPSITVCIAILQWMHAQMTNVSIDYFYGELNTAALSVLSDLVDLSITTTAKTSKTTTTTSFSTTTTTTTSFSTTTTTITETTITTTTVYGPEIVITIPYEKDKVEKYRGKFLRYLNDISVSNIIYNYII